MNRLVLNEISYFGRGSRKELKTEIQDKKFKNGLVVTDKPLLENGVTNMVTEILDEIGFEYRIYSDVKPNPDIQTVKNGLMIARENNIDLIIAVGGGSSIDTAKAISIVMTNSEFEDITSLEGVAETKNKGLPLIAIPTTSGTAAEVTINYVITNELEVKKMVCVDPHDIPICAIIDQELMEQMPKELASSTGMDALTHAMEGYITKAAWLIPDMFHLNAMSLIYKNLEKAVNDKDIESIDNMGLAQYIAGMGFSNVGLGIVHSMAHALGALYDAPHGVCNAILLPYVLEFNGEDCPELFYNMAKALELKEVTHENAVSKVVEAVRDLSKRVGIPKSIKDIGTKEEDLTRLAHMALNDVCTPGNPREVTEEDILRLYKKAFENN